MDTAEGVQYQSNAVIIEGVISPRSQGGWPHDDVHCFFFGGWQLQGGAVVQRELTLLRPVPKFSAGHKVFDELPEYSLQRMRVLLSSDDSRAIVEAILPAGGMDSDLEELSQRL